MNRTPLGPLVTAEVATNDDNERIISNKKSGSPTRQIEKGKDEITGT